MADLFSRSFHYLIVPCRNFPPRPSERLRISASVPLFKRWVSFTHRTHVLPSSTSSSSSVPEDDVHLITSTECSDGSFVFRFGNASELREKMDELEREKLAREGVEEGGKAGVRALSSDGVENFKAEVDHNLEKEIESSSVVAVGVADKNPQLLVNEKESVVLDNDPDTAVINDSPKIDGHVKLDSVEDGDGQHEISSEDVVAEGSGVSSVSEEDSQVDTHKEEVVSTVTPESDVFSDLNSGAYGNVEEKEEADKGHGVDGVTNNLIGGVDAELSELVPVSTLESEQVVDRATENLTGGVEADLSELMPAPNNVAADVDADLSELMPTTNNLIGGVDADLSESIPAPNNVAGGVDDDSSEWIPATNNVASGVDAEFSESISASNNLTGGVDADLSESMPVFTSLESELVANDEETTHHIVDDSIDASKMGKSAMLHDLVPSSDSENRIDVSNTVRSDDEDPSHLTVSEIHSVEMASHGEKTSRTELFLVSGAACLPHPSKALTGREDAYFISGQNWLAVADGVGQWSLEGSNAGLYILELMEKCESIVSNYESISTLKPAEVLVRGAAETQSPGSSSALVAYFDGQALHAANVGNTGFIIIRDGSIFKKSTAMFHEFSFPLQIVKGHDPSEIIEVYKIDLNEGDVILFATNGLFDNLYEQEIATIISKCLQASLRPQEIAEFLAMRAQEVGRSTSTRSPFADAAQAVGYVGYSGGKLDDVTVIVSLVQTR